MAKKTTPPKTKTPQPDLFSQPQDKTEKSPVAEIKTETTEHLGLVFDTKLGLSEVRSREAMGDKEFTQTIIGIYNGEAAYSKYDTVRELVILFLETKLPLAAQGTHALIFKIISQANKDVSLCFDHGKLNLQKTFESFDKYAIEQFIKKISSGQAEFQQYKIWIEELKVYMKNPDIKPVANVITSKNKKANEKAQRKREDDNFHIPQSVSGLPYIHIENGTLAIEFMVWLYTDREIEKVFKKIQDAVPPYDLPWLKDMASKVNHRSLGKNEGADKIRNWKGRLTQRLQKLLIEREIPVRLEQGILTHTPTGVESEGSYLIFSLRPHQWKAEILNRVERIQNGNKKSPEKVPISEPKIRQGLPPAQPQIKEQIKPPVPQPIKLPELPQTQTSITDAIRKKHPEIFFLPDGKFDLASMKTKNDFNTAMDTLVKILYKRHPFSDTHSPVNQYLYGLMDELLDKRGDKELMEKIIEGEELIIDFFDKIDNAIHHRRLLGNYEYMLYCRSADSVNFRLTATIGAMDFIWDDDIQNNKPSTKEIFKDRSNRFFIEESRVNTDVIKLIIWETIEHFDQGLLKLLKIITSTKYMFLAYKKEGDAKQIAQWLRKQTIRENFLDVPIAESSKYYRSPKYLYINSDISKLEFYSNTQNKNATIEMLKKYGYEAMVEMTEKIINMQGENADSVLKMKPLFDIAGLTKQIEGLEKEHENIKYFFSFIARSLTSYGHAKILHNTTTESEEHWDSLYDIFDMINGGLQRYIDNIIYVFEEYDPRFAKKYGETNPYKDVIKEIVTLNIPGIKKQDFATLISSIHYQHLANMFASYYQSRDKDGSGIDPSFKRNALKKFFEGLMPKKEIQNFRRKNKVTPDTIHATVAKRNQSIKKVLQEESTNKLSGLIQNNHIEGITVLPGLLVHEKTGVVMVLPFLYGKSDQELLDIVYAFIDQENRTIAISQMNEEFSQVVGVTPEIIANIQSTINQINEELEDGQITMAQDKQLLEYNGQKIPLSEITIGTSDEYEILIRLWMGKIKDGIVDNYNPEVDTKPPPQEEEDDGLPF